jgi:septal ring factor EnvC (AmiA/AmiB activator)
VQALAADAERLLTAQAQQHVSLERELVQLRALVTDFSAQPAAMTERVQRLEQALDVLHANLTTARQYLATLLSQEP